MVIEITGFTHITEGQRVVDALKGFVLAASAQGSVGVLLLRSIRDFEKLAWVPRAFEDAWRREATGVLAFDEKLVVQDLRRGVNTSDAALLAIDAVLREYTALVNREMMLLAEHAAKGREYTAQEAAEYLGIARETFNKYATRRKQITGRLVGSSMVYTQSELDRWRAGRVQPPPTSL